MARSKQQNYTKSKAKAPRAALTPTSPDRLVLKDYLALNLVFGAFCFVQLMIVRLLLRDFAGLYFFFGFIICAFMVASVFDYMAEKMSVGLPAEENL